ncbi:hypothetical protein, partial [Pararobbsia alpina]|uniref:hypothetical protein n=1 Tax=Pararobbsia alpina TaxID=621374 RepID=UPI001C2ED980
SKGCRDPLFSIGSARGPIVASIRTSTGYAMRIGQRVPNKTFISFIAVRYVVQHCIVTTTRKERTA